MTERPSTGNRIAKVLSRAGVASRREAERMIAGGRVSVNGQKITSPALNVLERDKILVDDKPIPRIEPPRLWRFHKPAGLVTTARDEKGRKTVFDALPTGLPRVMPVGRLDLNSEGLLLLTNDGELKRWLEHPSTAWIRRYRVRVRGKPGEEALDRLRQGISVAGEEFGPMEASLDRQLGANAWLTAGLRQGRNREVRRAMEAVGLVVNRLIRTSFGPFELGELGVGEIEEVRPKRLQACVGALAGPTSPSRKARGPKRSPATGSGKPGPNRRRKARRKNDRLADT